MLGVAPVSLALTIWQIITQKGIRLDLLRTREGMDGTVVEQLGGIDYVRAAHTHKQEVRRVARAAERRRSKEMRHHFEMSLFGAGKAINEGFFHVLVLAFAVYLFVQGRLQAGRRPDVLGAVPQRDGPAQRDPSLHGRGAREQPEDRRPARPADGAGRPLVPDAGRRGDAAAGRRASRCSSRRAWRSSSAPRAARRGARSTACRWRSATARRSAWPAGRAAARRPGSAP